MFNCKRSDWSDYRLRDKIARTRPIGKFAITFVYICRQSAPLLNGLIRLMLQHYRDILKMLQLIANCKESKEIDHHILTKLIAELQVIIYVIL